MQTYMCKCGRVFEKSSKAETTGYVLDNYSPQHECYGCPYIVKERDWITKEVTKIECRATPQITYHSRCKIGTESKDHKACYLFSLDLVFVKRVLNFVNSLDGAERHDHTIPDEWRAADFGQINSYDCFGLGIFPLFFQKNRKGTEARRAVKERFFYPNGYRKGTTEEIEKDIIMQRIEIAKENARKEQKEMGKIDFTALKNNKKAVEESVPDNVPTELAESYSNVWGGTEKITDIEVSRLKPYKDGTQPYKINPEKVSQIAASATDIGIITPLRVRAVGNVYEVICGHHRLEAAKSIGQLTVPCIIKDYSDDEVFRILSESNIQREKTLPSEYGKIFAKYMELRNDDETTAKEIAKKFNVSKKTMYRYLDVTKLINELQEMTDTGVINFGAVEYIAKLDTDVQNALFQALSKAKVKLSVALAKRVRSLCDSSDELIDVEDIVDILTNKEKPNEACTSDEPTEAENIECTPTGKENDNDIYSAVRARYNIDYSDNEIEKLITELLDKHFKSVSP
ncbi:MAG: ParB/RepB/Spo0J family partition protein [Ruminococcus sp.]|nr:ParB/RepB/Spo0J family partition protein [Ruminococcus sp.]